MRQLLLLRHAKAISDDPHTPDHARPLAARGRQAAQLLRHQMRGFRLGADLVLVSSARRTVQTLQSLAPWIAPGSVEPMDALYLAATPDLLHLLRQIAPTMHSVLLIGHNPGLHELALMLGDRDPVDSDAPGAEMLADGFPPAGLAQFDVPEDWGQLGAGRATLRRFLTPEP